MSLPSPGFQMKVSLPSPRSAESIALAAGHRVVAGAADQGVGAVAADDGVAARTAIDNEAHGSGRHGTRIDSVVAVAGADRQHVGAFRPGDGNLRRQAADRHGTARSYYLDLVVTAGAGDRDVVD